MFNKIFNKFIALLVFGICAYLIVIFFIISPQITDFFYQSEFKSVQNQLERVSNVIDSKAMYMKNFEHINPKKTEIEFEKSIVRNNLKELIAQMKVLYSGRFFIIENRQVIMNKKEFPSSLLNQQRLQNIIQKKFFKIMKTEYIHENEEYYSLITYNDYFKWYVLLNIKQEDFYTKANSLNSMIHNITLVILLVIFICGFILAKRVLNPINELSKNALKVKEGDFTVRNQNTSNDELGLLSKQFNFMLDTIQENIHGLEEKVKLRTQELHEQLYKDDVTHLQNRYALLQKIKDNQPATLVLIDINSFNDINELYGYKVGNEVLSQFAFFLEKIARSNDAEAYKIYGNVFAIMFNDSMFIFDKFEHFVNNLLEDTKKELFIIEKLNINIYLDITVGIAICQTQALKKANIALQKAKKKHRLYVVYNSEIDRKQIIQDTIFWRNKIEDAIENDKIIPFAQAIVNKNQEIIKYEMLMRMKDVDEQGNTVYLSPFKFLDISVKTKQYLTLSNIMIDKSLSLIDKTDKLISINISFLDIDDVNFIHFLEEKINSIDEKHYSRIVFEIVESNNISHYGIFDEFLETYRKKGIQIAIDDFGTGYSNFSHIMKIRPDYLKIDASLIKDIDKSKDSYELVKSIVAFSKELNMKTIAEFVHSKEVFELALQLGIDEFQGYYFSKPEKDFK